MKKYLTLAGVVTMAIVLMLMSSRVKAQDAQPPTDPASVYLGAYEALNSGDLDGGMALFADTAVAIVIPPPRYSDGIYLGSEGIRESFEGIVDGERHWEFSDVHVNGERVNFVVHFEAQPLVARGVPELVFSGVAIVQDGQIQSDVWQLSTASQRELAAANQRADNRNLTQRFYDEIWNAGDMAVADEIVSPDFIDGFMGQNGVESLKEIVGILRAAYPDLHVEYEDMVAEGDTTVVRVNATGTYAGGAPEFLGIPDSAIGENVVIFTGVDYARFADGQMVEGWGAHDDLLPKLELGYELTPPAE